MLEVQPITTRVKMILLYDTTVNKIYRTQRKNILFITCYCYHYYEETLFTFFHQKLILLLHKSLEKGLLYFSLCSLQKRIFVNSLCRYLIKWLLYFGRNCNEINFVWQCRPYLLVFKFKQVFVFSYSCMCAALCLEKIFLAVVK